MITEQDWEPDVDEININQRWKYFWHWVERMNLVAGGEGGYQISLVWGAGGRLWSVVRVVGWWDGGWGMEAWR